MLFSNRYFRTVFCYIFALFFFFSGFKLSFATPSEHVVIARNILNEVMLLLKSNDKSDRQKKQTIADRYMKNINFEWSAKMALGRSYLQLSPKDQSKYLEEYRKYVMYTWLQKLNYNPKSGLKINVLDKSSKINDTDENIILLVAFKDGAKYNISLRTRMTNNNLFQILNLSFESVDIALTYRSQFLEYMEQHKNDPKSVIGYLKKQNREKEKTVNFRLPSN